MISVRFVYVTGLTRDIFRNPRLSGDWDGWVEAPMTPIITDDGCPGFAATVQFDDALAGRSFRWGVRLDGPQEANAWGIPTEVPDPHAVDRFRVVRLPDAGADLDEFYYLTYTRRLGAQKVLTGAAGNPDLRFAVWAPNAKAVDVVFGLSDSGYIGDDGTGVAPAPPPIVPLHPAGDGIWQSDPVPDFTQHVGASYMFRIRSAQDKIVYRTDIYSRQQIGKGDQNPTGGNWDGQPDTLDSTVSCSVIVDPDIDHQQFWLDEFSSTRPVPSRMEDLVIYELHVGSLGFPGTGPGTLADAIGMLDHLDDLGVNAIELMPLAEFSGRWGWGYGNTHPFAIESSAGGRNDYKLFVRECHRRGMAVIQDVVYNHFDGNASRTEWEYDSTAPEENIYYWYEGKAADYQNANGGYLNNGSSGFAPRYWEEPVRQLFVSSAAALVDEFHIDGLRVDLTQAIHRDNTLNANGWTVAAANQYGQKLFREWSRTLRMIRPSVFLIAEDHSGWPAVTQRAGAGGLGFDATWFAAFYHSLIGDADAAAGSARLLREAGFGGDGPLAMQQFAGELWKTQFNTVDYHESHDEAANATGSARTSRVAVDGAPLLGPTRRYAEARCRVAAGLSLLSAGTPMIFMGEEIVAQKPFRYDSRAAAKEDLLGERLGSGAAMFRYYQDLIRLRRTNVAVRSRQLDVVHANDQTRVIAFTRTEGTNEVLIVASLNNHPFDDGYEIQSDPARMSGRWREIFNSDAGLYGGDNVGNYGEEIQIHDGKMVIRIPANGLLVFRATSP
jgi:1,4-alpha-glucan branching enzyme